MQFSPAVVPTDKPASQTRSAEEDHTQDGRRKREADVPPQVPVAAVIVYRTLGQLLPERFDPDRRSLRYNIIRPLNWIRMNFKEWLGDFYVKTLAKGDLPVYQVVCQIRKLFLLDSYSSVLPQAIYIYVFNFLYT